MKEHETDSKVDFRKKSGKKKKNELSGLSGHLKKKKHQLDWSSIKILAKEKSTGNADQRKRILLLNTRIKHHF